MIADPSVATTVHLLELAPRLVRLAAERGCVLRVCGSVAVRLLPGPGVDLLARAGRHYKDIDLVTRRRNRTAVRQLFTELKATEDQQIRIASDGLRFTYNLPPDATAVDLFVDDLSFCHRLRLADRLEESDLCLPPADLLLQKIQIVAMTDRDDLDVVALLLSCPLAEEGGTYVSLARLRAVLAGDWGFHHTCETNLLRLEGRLRAIPALTDAEREIARTALRFIVDSLHRAPKSVVYRLRSLVGTRLRWYEDVSDETRLF